MKSLELNQSEKLNELVKYVRSNIRTLLNQHIEGITHDEKRRDIESQYFWQFFSQLSKKWIFEILWELEIHKGLTFNEIGRHIEGISTRSLSDRLKYLKQISLITRTVQDTIPPSVLYEITDKGRSIVEISVLLWWQLSH